MRSTLIAAAFLLSSSTPSSHAQSLAEQARGADQRGQLDSAYDIAQAAAKAEPDNAATQALLGDIACEKAQHASGLGRFGPARKCKAAYGKAVALEPSNPVYLEDLAQFLSQAPGIAGGDRDSAIVLAEAVRRIDQRRGTFLLGRILYSGDAKEKARADSLVEAWAQRNSGRTAQLQMAGWWVQTNRPERSLDVYLRLVARDSTDPVVQFGVGRNMVVLKREPRVAQAHLRLAVDAPAPDSATPGVSPGAVWWRIGQAYVQLGIPDSARLMYEKALQINPKLTQARVSLDSLPKR